MKVGYALQEGGAGKEIQGTVVDAFGAQDAVFRVKAGKREQEVVRYVERVE